MYTSIVHVRMKLACMENVYLILHAQLQPQSDILEPG